MRKEIENDASLKERYEEMEKAKEIYFSFKKKKEGKFVTMDEALYFQKLIFDILREEK